VKSVRSTGLGVSPKPGNLIRLKPEYGIADGVYLILSDNDGHGRTCFKVLGPGSKIFLLETFSTEKLFEVIS